MSQDKDNPTITPEEATYRLLLTKGFEPELLTTLLADEAYTKPLQEARTVAVIERIAESDPYAAMAALKSMTLEETTSQAAYASIAARIDDSSEMSRRARRYCMMQTGPIERCKKDE
ncbi:hypothetical protein HN592_04145 [Candidatus Woesearchaeota archaeon]|jgi:hypothetical protein|nr:hypothetical protein [Candidatus Woesearchaeota archaeon]MBT4368403.1 hypothetical protein [Candidatus Woesearchaeota archaeon]MBT4712892.1 hypothetical protein [Candidatus Woesearchaeota archaeon]MBT6639804.1 hypothetical protein [Candidatus Woesearchaeota archaeon]MBT7133976.1 hypothetical protein [Candidatus Woesearchaeota archaeon]